MDGRKREKRKHVRLSIADKLKVIEQVERGENRKTNNGRLLYWCLYSVRSKPKLQKFVRSGQSMLGGEIRKTLNKTKLEQLDEVV